MEKIRDRHVAVAYGESIFIFGGYDGQNRVNDFWQYHTVENVWELVEFQGTPPTARHSHSAVEWNGETLDIHLKQKNFVLF